MNLSFRPGLDTNIIDGLIVEWVYNLNATVVYDFSADAKLSSRRTDVNRVSSADFDSVFRRSLLQQRPPIMAFDASSWSFQALETLWTFGSGAHALPSAVLLFGVDLPAWLTLLSQLCRLLPTWNAAHAGDLAWVHPTVTEIKYPPNFMPESLRAAYTLNGTIPSRRWYWQNALSGAQPAVLTYDAARIEGMREIARQRRPYKEEYPHLDQSIYSLLSSYPISGLEVVILGSTEPWYEALALEHGAIGVTVVEYGQRKCDYPQLTCITPAELRASGRRFDVAFSFSSFEHDGLGRYGDPLDPVGDLKAMAHLRDSVLKEGGRLYLSVPQGPDYLYWNAHRVYGPVRWPMLTAGWVPITMAGTGQGQEVTLDTLFHSLPAGEWLELAWLLQPEPGSGKESASASVEEAGVHTYTSGEL